MALSRPPQVTIGINYLKTTQNADRSLGGTETSLNGILSMTATALHALRAVDKLY